MTRQKREHRIIRRIQNMQQFVGHGYLFLYVGDKALRKRKYEVQKETNKVTKIRMVVEKHSQNPVTVYIPLHPRMEKLILLALL